MRRVPLGQHFLVGEAWQKKIVNLFQPSNGFGEIGPGKGALTQHLKNKFSDFVVFEKDPQLCALHKNKSYQILEGDFLDWNFLIHGKPVQDFSFIGNLPYESGTAIVKKLIEKIDQVESFLFLLQKEVVERMSAISKTKNFGSLTVLVQGQFEVHALDIIPPQAFIPPPQVFSQLILGKKREERHPTTSTYQKFIAYSFLHKRKVLRNVWKKRFSDDQMNFVFQKFHFDHNKRAEEIEVDLWPTLFKELIGG